MDIDFVEMMMGSLDEAVTQLDGALISGDVKMVHDLKALILDLQVKINTSLNTK